MEEIDITHLVGDSENPSLYYMHRFLRCSGDGSIFSELDSFKDKNYTCELSAYSVVGMYALQLSVAENDMFILGANPQPPLKTSEPFDLDKSTENYSWKIVNDPTTGNRR